MPKPLIWSVLLSCTCALFAGIGFMVGRYTVIDLLDAQIQSVSKAFLLGDLLDDAKKKSVINAYYHPDQVLPQLDHISWSVPNVPTPFVGNAPTPGQHGNATINAMQFRANTDIEMPKPQQTYRIFITGGSTAYGSGAPSQERTISGYLTQLLVSQLSPLTHLNYEVFTMANPAWATTHERIIIENRLSELAPDLVISFSGNNDVHWGKNGRNILWFRTYADDFFLEILKKAYEISGQPAIPEVIQISSDKIAPDVVTQRLMKNVALSTHVLAQANAHYIFALQPTLAVTQKDLTKREQALVGDQAYFRQCYQYIDAALQNFHKDNYHYINLANSFDHMTNQQDVFIDSYHFADKGNEIVAKRLFKYIKKTIGDNR